MMKAAIVLTCLIVAAFAIRDFEWDSFKANYAKTYKDSHEERYRRSVFLKNKKYIEEHNEKYRLGQVSYTLTINPFADMTNDEFKAERTNMKPRPASYKPNNLFELPAETAVPDSIDWRDEGYVTAVKDMGMCGTSWPFSATGSLEGQHFAATGNLVSLSEQNLIDCAGIAYGNLGCNGGQTDAAFDYIIDNNGLDTEASYPYEGKDGSCRYRTANKGATMSDYKDTTAFSEDALKQAVGTVGPVSVVIDASGAGFQLYHSGIYYSATCSSISVNLAVLAVGYGTEGGEDYWLVKNSWGTLWGEEGYIQMARNRDNNCGIATQPSYPIVQIGLV